jgi:hypothetical protein
VISRSDWTGEVEDLDGNKVHVYAQSETSMNEPAGLFQINCKHYPMTFIPGFSTLKGEPQDPEENEKAYEESQQQRALERKLREEKRDLEVMKAQGADPEAIKAQRQKVAKASSDIDDFCEETGRARRRNREYTPVNAKFPPKDSYNPADFPTEQRDRINDWFRNGGDNPPPQPTNIHLGPDNIPPQGQAQIPIGAGNDTATIPPSDAYKSGVNDSKPSRNGNSGKTEKDMEFMRNLENEREKVDSMNPMQKGAYLLKHGVSSKEELLEAAKNGTIQDHVDRYFNALNKNGSYASSKPLIGQPTISEETAKSVGWTKARMEKMSEITGLSGDEGVHVFDQMTKWTSNMWGDADTSAIDRYIDSDGTYDGTIWRGLHFGTEDEYREFSGSAFIGDEIHAGHSGKNASWSSLKDDATTFASTGDYQVVIQCVGNKSGAPISYLNQKGEQEVVAHSEAWYTVVGRKEVDTGSGKRLEITVVEKEVRKP